MEDVGEHHPGDGNNRLLVTFALLDALIFDGKIGSLLD